MFPFFEDVRKALITVTVGFTFTAASCGYNSLVDRIAKLEAVVPVNSEQIAAIHANESTTATTTQRIERKIDWIMEYLSTHKK